MQKEQNQRFYHTGPHHDDIILGLLPYITHQLREASNSFDFTILTSGFTAVTNHFIINALRDILYFLYKDERQMIHYRDFYMLG